MKLRLARIENPEYIDLQLLTRLLRDASDLSLLINAVSGLYAPTHHLEISHKEISLAARDALLPPRDLTEMMNALQDYCEACQQNADHPGNESKALLQQAQSNFEPETMKSVNLALRKIGSTTSRTINFAVGVDDGAKRFNMMVPHKSVIKGQSNPLPNDDLVEIKSIEKHFQIRSATGANIILYAGNKKLSSGECIQIKGDARHCSYRIVERMEYE